MRHFRNVARRLIAPGALALSLVASGAISASATTGISDLDGLLERLRTAASSASLTDVAAVERTLGLAFALDESWNPGDRARELYRVANPPAYLSRDLTSDLRIGPSDRAGAASAGTGDRSAILTLTLARDVCLRIDAVERIFGMASEWRRVIHRHGGRHDEIVFPTRDGPVTSVRFSPAGAGCVRRVAIDENCFSEDARGCSAGPEVGIGIGIPVERPTR